MKKMAFLSPVFPFPLDRGKNLRIFHMLRACSRDFDVTLIAPAPATPVVRDSIESLCERVIYVSEARSPNLILIFRYLAALHILPTRSTLRIVHSYAVALKEIDLSAFELI